MTSQCMCWLSSRRLDRGAQGCGTGFSLVVRPLWDAMHMPHMCVALVTSSGSTSLLMKVPALSAQMITALRAGTFLNCDILPLDVIGANHIWGICIASHKGRTTREKPVSQPQAPYQDAGRAYNTCTVTSCL